MLLAFSQKLCSQIRENFSYSCKNGTFIPVLKKMGFLKHESFYFNIETDW